MIVSLLLSAGLNVSLNLSPGGFLFQVLVFQFWFNTFFVSGLESSEGEASMQTQSAEIKATYRLVEGTACLFELQKKDLEKVNKNKENEIFSSNFKVRMACDLMLHGYFSHMYNEVQLKRNLLINCKIIILKMINLKNYHYQNDQSSDHLQNDHYQNHQSSDHLPFIHRWPFNDWEYVN